MLSSLDVSNSHNLGVLYCDANPALTSLYMKNGKNEFSYNFTDDPNLTFICVDESQLQDIQDYVNNNNIGNNPTITSDCLMATQEVSANKILVYPNPVKDVLYIQRFDSAQRDKAEIYDMSGKKVKTFNGNSVNVSNLQKGMYILKIDGQTVKFIKE
ncbi:MAG: T9SS type A sorting domain-containing protein [Flavobacteriaceae bacterium]|nr:T9SS type A sorting domain-containing protein [Flavobacteriaceae bacterium]